MFVWVRSRRHTGLARTAAKFGVRDPDMMLSAPCDQCCSYVVTVTPAAGRQVLRSLLHPVGLFWGMTVGRAHLA